MSTEPEIKSPSSGPSLLPQNLDLTGLPVAVAEELRRLVGTLRDNLAQASGLPASAGETPDQWARRLQEWVDAHPSRTITIDDNRESIYAGRGE